MTGRSSSSRSRHISDWSTSSVAKAFLASPPSGLDPASTKPSSMSTSSASRSEEHTSELQSLMRISYAVFCLKQKNHSPNTTLLSYHLIYKQHNTSYAQQLSHKLDK